MRPHLRTRGVQLSAIRLSSRVALLVGPVARGAERAGACRIAVRERLPSEVLRIIYPVAYWDLIQKYSAENGLDPYVVAALTCQESTFVANIRSPAKAVGLMQLEPPTARQLAKRLKLPYSSKLL